MGSTSMKSIVEGLLSGLLAFLLTFASFDLNGYTVVPALIPVLFISFRRGLFSGILAGTAAGVLQLLLQREDLPLTDAVIALLMPFVFVGIAGVFAKFTQRTLNNKRFPNAALNIVTGSLLGSAVYFIWRYIYDFFLSTNAELGTAFGSFALTLLLAAVLLLLAARLRPSIFIPKDTPFLSRKEKSRLLND